MPVATPPVEKAPRAHLVAACILVALLALITTSRFWYEHEDTEYLARYHADSQQILACARDATARDWLRWWTGSWIEIGMHYYRPVTSTLMGIEWKLFGGNVIGFCATGWLIHALNAVLLFLLGFRIYRGSAGTRMLMGLTAAALFTLPTRGNQGAAAADVQWWPAQTDMLSLTFALASLLALDRALTRSDPPPAAEPAGYGGENPLRGWGARAAGLPRSQPARSAAGKAQPLRIFRVEARTSSGEPVPSTLRRMPFSL